MMRGPEHLSCIERLRTGIFQPRDEKTQGECYKYLKGRCKERNWDSESSAQETMTQMRYGRFPLNFRKHFFLPWGWPSTGTSCPERRSVHPWRFSKAITMSSWETGSGCPWLMKGVEPDDLLSHFKHCVILWKFLARDFFHPILSTL